MKTTNIKLDSVDRFEGGVNGFATGRNGWRFGFNISHGEVEIDTRENVGSDALDDARQIRRELKKIFSDLFRISKLRAAVGRKGAEARWSGRNGRATACMRVYPADAAEIKKRAKAAAQLPADIVAEMVKGSK